MKVFFTTALCAILCTLSLTASASTLIITKDHRSFLADEIISESGTELVFKQNGSGRKMAIDPAKIDTRLPRVVRGSKYDADTCAKNVELVEKAIKRHPKLKKQLISLHNEWSSFSKVDKNIPTSIDSLMADFRTGAKTARSYNQAMYEIQMLRYKDSAGHFDTQSMAAESEILNTFLGIDLIAAEKRATAESIKLDEFEKIVVLFDTALSKELPDKLRKRVITARETARGTTINGYITYSKDLFKSKGSVDALIYARSILRKVRNEVVVNEDHKKRLLEHDAEIVESARAKLKGFKVNEKGFALTKKDLMMEQQNTEFCSTLDLDGVDVIEDCYVIPPLRPTVKDITRTVRTTYMLVFNHGPLGKKDYNIMILASDGSKEISQQFSIPPFKMGSGHGVARLSVDLSGLPAGAMPLKDEKGEDCVKAYIMSRDKGSSDWQNISKGFKIPIGIPEL